MVFFIAKKLHHGSHVSKDAINNYNYTQIDERFRYKMTGCANCLHVGLRSVSHGDGCESGFGSWSDVGCHSEGCGSEQVGQFLLKALQMFDRLAHGLNLVRYIGIQRFPLLGLTQVMRTQ